MPGVVLIAKGSSCQHWSTELPLMPSRAVMFKAGVVMLLSCAKVDVTSRRAASRVLVEVSMLTCVWYCGRAFVASR